MNYRCGSAATTNPWGETPSKDGEACLERDAAGQPSELTYNRWTWCHKTRIAIDIGSGTQRGIRTYLRVEEGSVSYHDWNPIDPFLPPPICTCISLLIADRALSTATARVVLLRTPGMSGMKKRTPLGCNGTSSPTRKPAQQETKVLYHDWHFRFGGNVNDGYEFDEGTTHSWQIRCDSADHFVGPFGREYPEAFVNYNVVSHLTYRISDPRVEVVAEHIRFAQNNPTRTYPIELDGPKEISGKYTGAKDDQELTRTPYQGDVHRANEDMKDRACKRKEPYTGWRGLPPYDTKNRDCDEYPFASINEGVSSRDWDFSVHSVPNSQNRTAVWLLTWYYFSDRILYDQDPFWVNIAD